MSDDTPTYLESNKPEAERCVELASAAWQAGDLAKAQRMLAKSLKLYPTRQAQELIRQLTKHIKEQQAQQEEENRYRQQQQQQQEQEARYRQQQQQQQQQRQQQSSGAHQRSNAHQSTPHKSAGTPTGPASPGGANYTGEQSDSARVILARRKDYYAIFQVSRTAEHAEIKTSYRKLALRFHPDKNKAPEAEEAFKVVSNAFQCLSDPQKRGQSPSGTRREATAHAPTRLPSWPTFYLFLSLMCAWFLSLSFVPLCASLQLTTTRTARRSRTAAAVVSGSSTSARTT